MDSYTALDVDRIETARKDARIGHRIILYESTSSTNDIAWEYSKNKGNHGLCVLAESQHKGRGRRGRAWYSPPGESILCSVLLTKTSIAAELLTLTAAIASAETMIDHCNVPCRIKWPNDILIQNQKVAGILLEKRVQNGRPAYVIGIGINCNQQPGAFEDCDLNLPATSLSIQTGQPIDRTELACELLENIECWLDKAVPGSGGPAENPVIQRWLHLSRMLGQHITVECDGQQYSGFCRGVDPAEGLILQLDNNLVRMFAAAQTSVSFKV